MTHLQLAALCAGIALIAGACFGVLLMRRRSLYTADPSPRAAAAIADLDDVATSAGYARRDVSWSSASAASGDNLVSERHAFSADGPFTIEGTGTVEDGEEIVLEVGRGDGLLIVELGSNDLTSKDGEHWTRADTLPEQVADRASTPEAATETPTFDQWSRVAAVELPGHEQGCGSRAGRRI